MDNAPSAPAPEILARNLQALRRVNPRLAEAMESFDPSPGAPAPARTRDGQLTFRMAGQHGPSSWLGQTSIPTVRAAALLESFDPGKGHVMFPGLGEGTEAHLLLQALSRDQRLFVWEPDFLTARLVLALRDYATEILHERLVLLVCPLGELAGSLSDWLDRHPGQACPARMMRWPWQTHAEIAEIRSVLEAIWLHQQQPSATKNPP